MMGQEVRWLRAVSPLAVLLGILLVAIGGVFFAMLCYGILNTVFSSETPLLSFRSVVFTVLSLAVAVLGVFLCKWGLRTGLRHSREDRRSFQITLAANILVVAVIGLAVYEVFVKDFLRAATEYELNENTFGSETIAKIEKDTGLRLPETAKGLKYHYLPPMDPIIFAKIEIPAEARMEVERQLKGWGMLPDYPDGFANDRCAWWPAGFETALISGRKKDGYYVEAYLVQEEERSILYVKYFTI